MDMPTIDSGKAKSFFAKPEGKVGAVLGIGLLGYGVYLFAKILPWLITLAENTLYLGGLVAAIFAALYVISDPRFRNIIWNLYKLGMRYLTGLVIDLDPINVLKNYIETRKQKLVELNEGVKMLAGQKRKLAQIISERSSQQDHNFSMASAAKRKGDDLVQMTETRKAMRLGDSTARLQGMLGMVDKHHKLLVKVRDVCTVAIEDLEDEVRVKSEEFEAIKTTHGAISRAMSILKGGDDMTEMYNETMERMLSQSAQRMGDIDEFMDWSTDVIKKFDLQNSAFDEAGLAKLNEFEQRLAGVEVGKRSLPVGNAPVVGDVSAFDELLKH